MSSLVMTNELTKAGVIHTSFSAAAYEVRMAARVLSHTPGRVKGLAAEVEVVVENRDGRRDRLPRRAAELAVREASDCVALVNHDMTQLLGRTSSGTLGLSVTTAGIEFDLLLPDTTLGRDVRTLVERGDLSECSYGFIVMRDHHERDIRVFDEVTLFDVSLVTRASNANARVLELRHRDRMAVTADSMAARAARLRARR